MNDPGFSGGVGEHTPLPGSEDSLGGEAHAVAPGCTGCKSPGSTAVARCLDCANFLCSNCVMAHQFMHCFEGHRVVNFGVGAVSFEVEKIIPSTCIHNAIHLRK